MNPIVLAALLFSTNSFAQSNKSVDDAFAATAARAQAVGKAESDLFSAFGKDEKFVKNSLVNFCEKAVYEAAAQAGSRNNGQKNDLDLLSGLDARICVEDLMLVLSKYSQKK